MHVPDGESALVLLLVHLSAQVPQVAGEPEVGDFAVFVVVHQDVAGRQVTVDYLQLSKDDFYCRRYIVRQ
jgi:hypothetical protein